MAPGLLVDDDSFTNDSISSSEQVLAEAKGANGSKNMAEVDDKLEPIAVVGLDLKFPQEATSTEDFWKMLKEGRSAMTKVPADRYNLDAFFHPDPEHAGAMHVRGGHFLKEDIAAFDAPFFSITPAEAECMDPQQRGLLETTYRALENAGMSLLQVAGSKNSVYVGCFTREYEALVARDPEMQTKYLATGTGTAMLSNRLSWFYDLTGPSITLDTACSSSLNAFHLACNSLRNRDATMSIVGGCNLFYNPDTIIPLTNLNFLSPDSVCHSFDHIANGYARGEGFGVVVVKLLSDDGRSPGITQPTRQAQVSMIQQTYEAGGLDYATTRYFEAHGTGTPIGDPIKARSAGMAGLIEGILVLEKGVIPPNIWFEKPNAKIPVDDWNIRFPTENTPWPACGLRRVSVNSFSYGGSNAHVVLDDACNYLLIRQLSGKHRSVRDPPLSGADSPREALPNGHTQVGFHSQPSWEFDCDLGETVVPRLFVWSTTDQAGLKRIADTYADHFAKHGFGGSENDFLRDLAFPLSSKRGTFLWRSFVTATSVAALIDNMQHSISKPARSNKVMKLGFVFTGQGAQWHAMGRELSAFPAFKRSLQDAEECFRSLGCKWSLLDEFSKDETTTKINNPAYSQPMCTALQIALVDLLESWNIVPAAVVGHSSGEIAAAFVAGGLSRESAWRVAYFRGILSAGLALYSPERGSMMAVALSEEDATQYLKLEKVQKCRGDISIGCINSPRNVTVTGAEDKVNAMKEILDEENIFARKLRVDNAYHSSYMEAISLEYWNLIKDITMRPSHEGRTVPVMYSSVTGQKIAPVELSHGEYWVKVMVSPVRFSDALSQMFSTTAPQTKIATQS
ncbi:hypothetical protein MMC18_006391 [Xylographa bjoerkii]|nr:hypothetical protein [Xylographa bjoerkii]